ncbi:MAG: BlaI/MecI/CopY family transcriptional regulator [Mariniblastus sp.]|mgnify:FL=1|jgi:BlaI family penicillinase repressor|nr:BlaI/MecI/CopY family transcriptional regulator [bacterium]MDG1511080.1 BlaI/MecI/CopY family transcriptional regulator [Mariniblastus sp.]MDG2181567.1 BlaI/MecI/CopY family transcriptional regulator [Mariniblastus sp.]|eukprot:COSAG01_NODE_761_length_13793_cov_1722.919819_2_plen_138_part_00
MPKISPSITDAEWRVMHEIWASEPVTSGEIAGRIQENTNWTSGTIKTLLHRLVQKGVLEFQRKGNRYLYRSQYSEAECVDHASGQMLHTVFKGRPVPMLEYLVKSARLSGVEVERLKDLLANLQKELPLADSTQSRT